MGGKEDTSVSSCCDGTEVSSEVNVKGREGVCNSSQVSALLLHQDANSDQTKPPRSMCTVSAFCLHALQSWPMALPLKCISPCDVQVEDAIDREKK